MTLYLNLRESQPQMMSGDGGPSARLIADELVDGLIQGRTVVFGVHGFNVRYKSGLRSLARLDQELKLPQSHIFVGVLWPGDFWVPVINYPVEWEDAGRRGVGEDDGSSLFVMAGDDPAKLRSRHAHSPASSSASRFSIA